MQTITLQPNFCWMNQAMSLWPRTLKQKTILVVVLVALLALGNVVTLQAMLRRFDDIGATVNLAGKMRMLSQRIALEALAENLAQGGNWPEVQERYASFTESYTALRQGGIAVASRTIIWSLIEQLRVSLMPLFHGLHRCFAVQC